MATPGRKWMVLPPERVAEIVAAYQGGTAAFMVGSQFGISETVVVRLLGEAGVKMRKPGRNAATTSVTERSRIARKIWRTRKTLAAARLKSFKSTNNGEDRLLGHQTSDQDPA